MGDAVSSDTYTPKQRSRYRQYLAEDLEIFDRHLQNSDFDDQGTIGLELELNLIDSHMQPARVSPRILQHLDSEYQSEIGSFNVELNHPPLAVTGDGLRQLEDGVAHRLNTVNEPATKLGAEAIAIGTLPTMTTDFLEDPGWMVRENRYRGLSNTVLSSRGELVTIDLAGREHYVHQFSDIAPESTCTSLQLHLQVAPERFAAAWNASQAIAGVQVALAANSPLFAGWDLWRESRIPVFRQSMDTRTSELVTQGVRPRVWFGERWITSVFDLFEENVRYFSPLLPESRQISGTPMMRGETPALHYLNLHNGTVWRWNRPIYAPGSGSGRAHLRVENRLLPAGPTPIDMLANAAFYYGLTHYLVHQTRPVWSRLTFEAAHNNFRAGARHGLNARMEWPLHGHVDVAELVCKTLLPNARKGLYSLGVDEAVIDRYLNVIEQRALTRQNGAAWQIATMTACSPAGGSRPDSPERRAALAQMVSLYLKNQATGKPVHEWEIPR